MEFSMGARAYSGKGSPWRHAHRSTMGPPWQHGFNFLVSFYEREGHSNVPALHSESGFGLGNWVRAQRNSLKEKRTLTQEQIKKLNGFFTYSMGPRFGWSKTFWKFKNSLLQLNVDGSIYSWLSNNEKSIFKRKSV